MKWTLNPGSRPLDGLQLKRNRRAFEQLRDDIASGKLPLTYDESSDRN